MLLDAIAPAGVDSWDGALSGVPGTGWHDWAARGEPGVDPRAAG